MFLKNNVKKYFLTLFLFYIWLLLTFSYNFKSYILYKKTMTAKNNKLSNNLIKNTFWLYIISYIIAPIWYIIKILLSSQLSVEEIWILYWVISFITLIWAFNDFWITESLKYFIPRFLNEKNYQKIKNILTYSISIQLTSSIIIASLLYIFSKDLSIYYFHNEEVTHTLKIFCLFFIWINFFNIITTFFMAVQNAFYSKIIDLIRLASSLLFIFLLIFLEKANLEYVSYMWLVWLLIWLIIWTLIFYNKFYKIYLKNQKAVFDKILFKKILKYALLVFMWAQAATILSQIDMQMIIYLKWTIDAWYYTIYLSIIWIPFLLLWPIFWILMPVFSDLNSKNKTNEIKKLKNILANNFIVIWFTFNLLFFIFAQTIAYILFWEKYIESWNILQYSILFLVFNFLLQINFNLLAWIWKVTARVKIISITIIINFILNLIFLNILWVKWAALATWIWWILIWLMSELYLWKKYFINLDYKFLTKNLFFIWLLWLFYYNFFTNIFIWTNRIISLIYMIIISIIWFWFFILINKEKFTKLILEIKKTKK